MERVLYGERSETSARVDEGARIFETSIPGEAEVGEARKMKTGGGLSLFTVPAGYGQRCDTTETAPEGSVGEYSLVRG